MTDEQQNDGLTPPDTEPTVIPGRVVGPGEILEKISKQFDLLEGEIAGLKLAFENEHKVNVLFEKRFRRVEQKAFDLPDGMGLGEGGLK